MDSIVSNAFLFRFAGRINRLKYWYAAFASVMSCGVFLAILAFAIGCIFGAGVKSVEVKFLDVIGIPPSLPFAASFRDAGPASAVSLIFYATGTPIFLMGMWMLLATTFKRLHDRDKSGWWVVVFFVGPVLFGKIGDELDDSYAGMAFALGAIVLNVWGFVELFCLRGTTGPNRFGADPLAPVPSADATPRWDQHRELEFVPHGAGPSPGPHVKRGA